MTDNPDDGPDGEDGYTDFDVSDYDVVISTKAKRSRFGATDSGLSAADADNLAELLDVGCEAVEDRVSDRALEVATNLARTLRRAEPVDED